jgi:hypothetical protein
LSRTIRTYQQKCHAQYAGAIGLPEKYTYPDGNPIRPLPPVQTAVNGLMIVGAYPSARFESRPSREEPSRRRLIPVADNLQPFGHEQYFDGVRVRTLTSADTLAEYVLSPLSLTLGQCWVTDLVKVFLYKPSHVDSCGAVKPDFDVPELRSQFYTLGRQSLSWLKEECEIGDPRLIVTLGQEVAQVIYGRRSAPADELLRNEITRPVELDERPMIHLPHPDACRRFEKWRRRLAEQIEVIKGFYPRVE